MVKDFSSYLGSDTSANTNTGAFGSAGSGDGGSAAPGMGMGLNPFAEASQSNPIQDLLINLNERHRDDDPTPFRDAEVDRVLAVLTSTKKSNAIITGPAGTGKSHIAGEIARRLAIDDPTIPTPLRGHVVYELQVASLVAGTMYRGMLEERMKQAIEFTTSTDSILFIDEIHSLYQNASSDTMTQALKPAMARSGFHLIGATTENEYTTLLQDPAMARRIEKVSIGELTPDQTLVTVSQLWPALSNHHQLTLVGPDEGLSAVVEVADAHLRHISARPDNALTLLDRTVAARVIEHTRMLQDMSATFIKQGIDPSTVPVKITRQHLVTTALGDLHKPGKSTLSELTQSLAHIRGQEQITAELQRRLLGMSTSPFPRTAPISWLFAGPSGVGKTDTVMCLAKHVNGEEPLILNMAEYVDESSVNTLLGSHTGYVGSESNHHLPFDALQKNPRQVILLDEFDKAHLSVQRLIMQAMETGALKTRRGTVYDFSKALIVMTTNAGAYASQRQPLGFGSANTAPAAPTVADLNARLATVFEHALLSRLDWAVEFNPIDRHTYALIIQDLYERLRNEVISSTSALADQLPDQLSADQVQQLVQDNYVVDTGARTARPAVQRHIENILMYGPPQTA